MPYPTKQSLPDWVRKMPEHAQEIWQSEWNSAYAQYKDEGKAAAVAITAVKTKYHKEDDNWVANKASEMFIFPVDLSKLSFKENEIPKEIQVLSPGIWQHPVYKQIKINNDDLNEFVQNFDNKLRKGIPITAGHSVGEEEKPAIGWFRELVNKGQKGLWAVIEWTKTGLDLLKNKSYKYFSPEFHLKYQDPETQVIYKNVLVGGALTNFPYFKGLKAIVLSEKNIYKEMTLEEVLKKKLSELTIEEMKMIKENKETLTDAQKEIFKDILKEEKKEIKPEDKPEVKKGNEGIIISKQTLEFLEKQASEGVKAMEILKRKEAEIYTQSLTFSETNQKGVLLPKSQKKVVDILLSLTETQQKKFKEVMSEMPRVNLFSELGKGSGIELKASEQINKLVGEEISKDKNLKYRFALEKVLASNPELAKTLENE